MVLMSGARDSSLPSAFSLLDTHFAILGAKDPRPAFFLDFDGTLAEIVDRPDAARLEPATRQVLQDLSVRFPTTIVSGRALADVRKRVGIQGLTYIGCHGFEIDVPFEPDLGIVGGSDVPASIERAVQVLEPVVRRVPGSVLEHKPFAVTIHYRKVDAAGVKELHQAVAAALIDLPNLRQAHGKKILELRPRARWGKGDAVRTVWTALERGGGQVQPFVFGDDLTDEDAFAVVRPRGLSIFVGPLSSLERGTAATHWLASPNEVTVFLRAVVEKATPVRAKP